MSQPVHDGVELIPRPEQHPAALKAALAVAAADRLRPSRQRGQDLRNSKTMPSELRG